MTYLGTRPILQDELRQYELHHRARIAIKPGITGMWQVSGRSDITDFEEVVRLDRPFTTLIRKSVGVGDLTVGDFWGIAKSHPSFNSPKGVSSVFVNTEKGQKLFEMMRVLAEVEEATLEEGMVKQHNLVQPSNRPVTRDTFYESDSGVFL